MKTNTIPRETLLFSLAQAINLTAAVISVTVAAFVGAKLAPSNALASLPYGVQFLFVLILTYPVSMLMKQKGRIFGFRLGAIMLCFSGAIGYIGVTFSNYYLLIISHAFLGAYVACANFYRFAAVDNVDASLKSKAMSLVVAGGLVAAISGPLVSIFLRNVAGFAEFSLCYGFFGALGVLTLIILSNKAICNKENKEGLQRRAVVKTKEPFNMAAFTASTNKGVIGVAILSAAVGYFIMNLLMIESSLVMKSFCSFNQSSLAIQAHVFSMFIPSLFSGALIKKTSALKVVMMGFVLLMICSLMAVLYAPNYSLVFVGLVLLGLGWNFTYVGGGAFLVEKAKENQRFALQGINDTLIAAFATIGAFSPSIFLEKFGWSISNWITFLLSLIMFFYVAFFFMKKKPLRKIKSSEI